MEKGHDTKCRELAEYFLPTFASERLKARLAQEIQDAVEDWFLAEAINIQAETEDAGARAA